MKLNHNLSDSERDDIVEAALRLLLRSGLLPEVDHGDVPTLNGRDIVGRLGKIPYEKGES